MKTRYFMLLVLVFLAAVVVPFGCKKKEHPPEHEHKTTELTKEAAATAEQIEQKTCPVMTNMKINPKIFTEYKGKKVYFCCNDCKVKFEADPEKYVPNLPQFKQ